MDGIRTGKYICNVIGERAASVAHDTYAEAKAEAARLCKTENKTVIVARIACVYQNIPTATEAAVHFRDCVQDVTYPRYAKHLPSQAYGMVIGLYRSFAMGEPEYLFVKGVQRDGMLIAYYDSVIVCPTREIILFSDDDAKNIAACKTALKATNVKR